MAKTVTRPGRFPTEREWREKHSLLSLAPRADQSWHHLLSDNRIPSTTAEDVEFFKQLLNQAPFTEYADYLRSRNHLEALIKEFMARKFAHIPEADRVKLSIYVYGCSPSVGFSAFAINEFVHNDGDDTFGQFIAKNWDRIMDDFLNLKWKFLTHSNDVIANVTQGSVFEYRSASPLQIRSAQENLTREEMRALLRVYASKRASTRYYYRRAVAVKDVPRTIVKDLLEAGVVKKTSAVTPQSLISRLLRGFSNSLHFTGDENYDQVALSEAMNKHLVFVRERIVGVEDSTGDLFYSDEIEPVVNTILEHSEKILTNEYFFLVRALHEPNLVIRGGTREELLSLLKKGIADEKVDTLYFLRLMGDVAGGFDGTLPSYEAWLRGFEMGMFSAGISMGLLMPMIGARVSKKTTRRIDYERRLFKSSID